MSDSLALSQNLLGDLLPEGLLPQGGLQKICDRLPELHRAKKAVGRTNSQTTATLMTLTMLADSPYRQMKQCLSQIDKKRSALLEAHFKTKKLKIKMKRWEASDNELHKVNLEEAMSQQGDLQLAAGNAMKEIGMYQDIYDQIRISHKIPVDWDEEDYEKTEVDHALRMAFRQAIQNIMATGRIAVSTSEYWEQFGVHPIVGERMTRDYIESIATEMRENKLPSVQSMHRFLDHMVETFKDEHRHSLTRIGVDAIINHQYAYKKEGKQ
jgi:hypothetical protein